MPELPRIVSDRYEIEEVLGQGGMGTVYRGRDRVLARTVAVKLLTAEMASDEGAAERLRQEARFAAQLNDPKIVAVFDAGVAERVPYLVMEYVNGHTLAEELRSEGRLPPRRAAAIAAGIAEGLASAHASGMIHRDVKPSNVMLTNGDDVKVTDFGVARAVEDTITSPSVVVGSAPYLAPEQARGEALDPRSDLYGLGVVLYEMLAGRPPFEADSPVAVAFKHMEEQPAPPSSHQPDIPPGLDGVVLRALAKDPEDRFGSAKAFLAALRPFAAGQDGESTDPFLAPGGVEEFGTRRPAPRPRLTVVAMIAVVLAVATVMALTLLGGTRSPGQVPGEENPRPSVNSSSAPLVEPSTMISPSIGPAAQGGDAGPGEHGGSSGSSQPTPQPTGQTSPSPEASPSATPPSSPPPPSPSPSLGITP